MARRNVLTRGGGGQVMARKLHEDSFVPSTVLRSGSLGF